MSTTPLGVEQRYVVVTSGYVDGPAQALVEHLRRRKVRSVTFLSHPLGEEDGGRHGVRVYQRGQLVDERTRRLPSRPPLTYPLDLLSPPVPPACDVWIGFNCLAAAQGLAARTVHRANRVAYWCVDFVPDRFATTTATRAYDRLDRLCCQRVDLRVELSQAAADGRDARHELGTRRAPTTIVPMGAWLDRVRPVSAANLRHPRAVYMGSLVERQGVGAFVRALGILARSGQPLQADIVGRGPEAEALHRLAADEGVAETTHFHGFIAEPERTDALLAAGAVALAPYDDTIPSFSRYADPGKLKAYLGAGLPIVMTDVPPNADELRRLAGAQVVPFDPAAIAEAIRETLADPDRWQQRHDAARAYAERFDWPNLFDEALVPLVGADTTVLSS